MSVIKRVVSYARGLVSVIAGAVDRGDVVFCAGLSAVGYGVSLVSVPAAWIVCGVVMMGFAALPIIEGVMIRYRNAGRK